MANPNILRWARESIGLDIGEAAHKIGLTDSAASTAVEKLSSWESGEKSPTRSQLQKISNVYKRPLVTFYLEAPPKKGDRGEDFRKHNLVATSKQNGILETLLRDVKARQEMVRSLVEDEDGASVIPIVGSAAIKDGKTRVAESISKALNFDFQNSTNRRTSSSADFFKILRTKVEQLGIFVLMVGDLGSFHSAIESEVFRGFVISDSVAPFIVINNNDAKSAYVFTLLHELVHLCLGVSGVCGQPILTNPQNNMELIERFCNDVAGELLLPQNCLKPINGNISEIQIEINSLASTWQVSEAMVAYRFYRNGMLTVDSYTSLVSIYRARWVKNKEEQKGKVEGSGPSYYVVKRSKLGNAIIDVVGRTLRGNLITHTKAAKILGVKPSSVEPLLKKHHELGYVR